MAIFGSKPAPIVKTTKLTQLGQTAGTLIVAHYAIKTIDTVIGGIANGIVMYVQSRRAMAALKEQEASASTEVAEATQGAQEAVDPNIFTVDQEVVEAVLRRSEEAKQSQQSEAANG